MFITANDSLSNNNISVANIINHQLIAPYFQSIIDISKDAIFGFEHLGYYSCSDSLIIPEQLFAQAKKEGLDKELDLYCVQQAIQQIHEQVITDKLFINILPSNLATIVSEYSDKKDKPLKHLIFEISEKLLLENIAEIKNHIKNLRILGAKIAIDDFGDGYSGLKYWTEIRPDFIKISPHFIQQIHKDPIKRQFVNSISNIANGLGCITIATGIENVQDMEMVFSLGIKLGQGLLLHKPEQNPKNALATEGIKIVSRQTIQQQNLRPTETIKNICEHVVPLWPSIRSDNVSDLFKKNPDISSIPIVHDQKPIGIISRKKILEIFSGRYAYQLHGGKPITDFMDTTPIIVDHHTGIREVSKLITAHPNKDLNTDFIITAHEHYIGVGKVSALLEQITDTQIRYARYSNPLTLLPGNVPIDEWIDDLLRQKEDFWLAYFDINHFKPFNDYFGYSLGDEVIKNLGDIIVEHACPNRDMVGHIGGDDFIVIFRSSDWETRCQEILSTFEQSVRRFYSKEHIKQQGIWCANRQGENTFFKLLSLAIGAISPDSESICSHHDISSLAADAKHQAKQQEGNYLFVCRRRKNKLSRFLDHSEEI
jgi:diguanylate cyclase (GGDEF)-like protein